MKVLILTSSVGNGHNSAAKTIKDKFLNEQPDCEIQLVDIYRTYASKLKRWIMEDGYFLACKHLTKMYNFCFKVSEKAKFKNRDKNSANKHTFSMLSGILNKIYEFKPDLIICTHVYSAIAITNIKRVYNIPAKVACMTLDYGISPMWECASQGLDYMFLTDEYMVDKFIERGYKNEQLYVSGIPVANEFTVKRDKKQVRELLNLKPDLFTIIVMKSSFFPISEKNLIKNLSRVNQKIQVIFINGYDKKSKSKLNKLICKYKLNHNIVNIGYTNQIPEYFSASDLVLGKAGGLTTTESLSAGLPSLIINKLPQQEIYNKDYLVSCGCALEVNKNNIGQIINKILDDKNLYNNMLQSAVKTKKINAVDTIYQVLKNVTTVEYFDELNNFTKRELISKINKQRKLDFKNSKKENEVINKKFNNC